MKVECPLGDIVDRVTILRIKAERIANPAQVAHVRRELEALTTAWEAESLPALHDLPEIGALLEVNQALWQVEDDLRDCEHSGHFGPSFVALARSVYRLNDRRAALKRQINETLGSTLVEQKSYR